MKSRLIYIIFLVSFLLFNFSLFAQKTVNSKDFAVDYSESITADSQNNPKGIYTVSVSSTNVSCYGLCDGTITVTLNGAPTYPVDLRLYYPADLGVGFVPFNNLNAVDFPFTITGLCGSLLPYQVRARDASNAIQWSPQVWVVAPGQMIIDETTIINETCAGSCDGSVKIVNIINAAFPVDYLWSTGSVLDSIGALCSGTYIVTITDANGCPIDSSFVFDPITPITPVVTNTGPYCVGDLIQLNVDAYSSYIWSGPGGFNSILQNPTRPGATLAMAGIYSVTVTDAAGCTGIGTTTVVVDALPVAAINPAAVTICEGQSTILTASGGGTYVWNTTEVTAAITVNPIITTTYFVTVTNAAGCTAIASATVTVTALVPQTITGNTPLCIGATDIWTSTTPGGTWTSATPGVATVGLATGLVTGISAGTSVITYSVTIGGCVNTAIKTVTITALTPQTITGNTPLCIGSTDVWTSTTPGGTWTSATPAVATVDLVTGLVTGISAGTSVITYTVTVGGCVNITTKTVTITALIPQTITGTTPLCIGSTAIWTSTTPGGTWTSATPAVATIDIATGLVTGISAGTSIITYSVTVGGCVNIATKTVTITAPVPQTITGVSPLCIGATDIWTSTTAGGTWTSATPAVATVGLATGLVTGISAGTSVITYSVTVGGCVNITTKTVTITAPIPQTITGVSPLCIGATDIWTSTTPGGTWTSATPAVATVGLATGLVTGVSAGTSVITYSVTVGGCVNITTKTVTITAPIAQTITGNTPLCIGATDVWTSTTPGGTWTSATPAVATVGLATGLVTGISAGTSVITYSVTVGGCVNITTKTVTITAFVPQTITGVTPLCIGSTDVWTSTTPGGTWTSATPAVATIDIASGLVTGISAGTSVITYSVTVGGCVNIATKTVTITAPIAQTITGNTPLCVGSTDIWTSTTPGGTWTSATPAVATVDLATGLVTGISAGTSVITYSVTVGGCVNITTKTVTITALIPQTITGVSPLCIGATDIWTSTTPGGTWTSATPAVATVDIATGLVTGISAGTSIITYSVTVGGCVNITTKTVTITAFVPQTITGVSPLCIGSTDVWTSTTPGGTWTSATPAVATIDIATGLVTGVSAGTSVITYSVTVGGCVNITTKTVTITAPIAQTITGNTPLCIGATDVWTSTTPGGTWTSATPAVATIDIATGLVTGISAGTSIITYSVTVGGCVNIATKTVTITAPIPQTITGITPLCIGSTDIWTSTTPGGTWTSATPAVATVDIATGLVTGISAGTSLITYSVTIGSCVNTTNQTVTITAPIAQTITGITPLCIGSTDVWTSTTPGGTWTSATPAVATVDLATGLVTGVSAGTSVITYSVTVGGCVNITTKTVTITAPIAQTITGNTPLCIGATDTWTSTSPGGTWTSATPGVATVDLNTGLVTGISAGTSVITYSVTIGGCINIATKTVTIAALPIATASSNSPVCTGQPLILTGGPNGMTSYEWNGPLFYSNSTQSPTVSLAATAGMAGLYTITVTDINGCTSTANTNVIINILTVVETTHTDVSCFGVCDGSIDMDILSGTPAYAYSWTGPAGFTSTNLDISNLCAGTYDLTVTDAATCVAIASVTITEPSDITLSETHTNIAPCFGNSNGTITITAVGGPSGTYTYDIGGVPQASNFFGGLIAGSYTITVTNGVCSKTIGPIIIIQPLNISVDSVDITDVLCFGGNTGSIIVYVSGGNPSYLYNIGGLDQVSDTFPNLIAGTYNITITDALACSTITGNITIAEPVILSGSVSNQTDVLCFGQSTGSVTVTGTGGIAPYTYSLDGGAFVGSGIFNGLNAGLHTITVNDSNGCTVDVPVTITEPVAQLTASISTQIDVSCFGGSDGSATVMGLGGTGTFTYDWSPDFFTGDGTDTYSNLIAGIYDVTVTDINLCVATASVTITEPITALSASITNTINVDCNGGNNGSATVTALDGTPNYSYDWSPDLFTGDGTNTYSDLIAGIYSVTVTDANGCSVVVPATITDNSSLSIFISDTNHVTCAGSCNGSATISASGGTPVYTYLWDLNANSQTDSTAINLCQGTYYVTVFDALLCSRIDSVIITEAAALNVTDSVIPISCSGLCDASIILLPTGGNPAYSFFWTGGLTNDTLSGLCAGTYYYTVTDVSGCTFTDSVTIAAPGTMLANLSIVDSVKCNGVCIGSVQSSPTGSFGYTYLWSNSDTTQTIINLCGGNYHVTVTGQGGCFVIDSIYLPEPPPLNVTFDTIAIPLCNGDSTGSIVANVTGGTQIYTYLWDANADSATTAIIDTLKANMYFITVTDANGCSIISNFELRDTSDIVITVIDSSLISCYGRCDGSATVLATGGTPFVISPFYNYSWSNLQSGISVNNLCVGSFIVTATDSLGCIRVRSIDITQPDSLSFSIDDSSSITCASFCNGSLTVNVTGGTLPYEYSWNNSLTDTLAVISNLCAGIQQLNITDSHNCLDSLIYNLTSPSAITTTITPLSALCNNNATDGSITVVVNGGSPQYTFIWSNDSTTQNLSGLLAGDYWLTTTDSLGCIKIDSATIGASITVNATARWDSTICYGDSIQIFGFGGSNYNWSPALGLTDSTLFNPWANPLQTTTYFFTVWDSICFDIDSVTIQVYPQIIVDAGPDQTVLYEHSATLTATSMDLTLSYLWNPTLWLTDSISATTTATPLLTTTYYVFATDLNGCVESDSVIVNVIPILIVPTGITPNGDGVNDVWMIDLIYLYPNCEVEIYNRWGEKLFYSLGYPDEERWDGTFKSKPLPTGTYYYIINLHDEEFDTKPITGPITIMR